MSETKWNWAYYPHLDPPEKQAESALKAGYIKVVNKDEADKVIAEKDAKILALDAEVFKQKHHAELFFDERNYAETQLRHSNHKRCLAMADYCYTNVHCIMGHRLCSFNDRTKEWFERWHKRWLELAEKFKEAK